MRAGVVSCGDVHRLCMINCVMPTARDEGLEQSWPLAKPASLITLGDCANSCTSARESCSEGTKTLAALDCVTNCTSTYHGELTLCTAATSSTTHSTFGSSLDACANSASARMDTCSDSCYGTTALAHPFPVETTEELKQLFYETRRDKTQR